MRSFPVGLIEVLTPSGCLAGGALGRNVDARLHQPQRFGVVEPLGGHGTDQGGQGVSGHTEPVGPGTPIAVVPDESLTNVEHERLHTSSLGARVSHRDILPAMGPGSVARCPRSAGTLRRSWHR